MAQAVVGGAIATLPRGCSSGYRGRDLLRKPGAMGRGIKICSFLENRRAVVRP